MSLTILTSQSNHPVPTPESNNCPFLLTHSLPLLLHLSKGDSPAICLCPCNSFSRNESNNVFCHTLATPSFSSGGGIPSTGTQVTPPPPRFGGPLYKQRSALCLAISSQPCFLQLQPDWVNAITPPPPHLGYSRSPKCICQVAYAENRASGPNNK